MKEKKKHFGVQGDSTGASKPDGEGDDETNNPYELLDSFIKAASHAEGTACSVTNWTDVERIWGVQFVV